MKRMAILPLVLFVLLSAACTSPDESDPRYG